MTRALPLLAVLLLVAPAAAAAQQHTAAPAGAAERAVARVNQAVVRVLAIDGADAAWLPSPSDPAVVGPDANVNLEYGTGIAVQPGIVVTAKHVVWGSVAVFIVLDGQSTAIPARVVYSDAVADVAFLAVDARLPHVVALPARPTLPASGADLWTSGFPIDPRETHAAVARSTLARVGDDGRLQLSAQLNPGNSGGPVFDAHGTLLGIAVERGDPAQGVQGVATAEPISVVTAAYTQNVAHTPPTTFDAFERALAVAMTRTLSRTPSPDTAPLEAVVASVTDATPPEERIVAALCAWGVVRHRLSAAATNDLADLTPEVRTTADAFRTQAVTLARRAFDDASYLRAAFSFGVILLRTDGDPAEMVRRVPRPPS